MNGSGNTLYFLLRGINVGIGNVPYRKSINNGPSFNTEPGILRIEGAKHNWDGWFWIAN